MEKEPENSSSLIKTPPPKPCKYLNKGLPKIPSLTKLKRNQPLQKSSKILLKTSVIDRSEKQLESTSISTHTFSTNHDSNKLDLLSTPLKQSRLKKKSISMSKLSLKLFTPVLSSRKNQTLIKAVQTGSPGIQPEIKNLESLQQSGAKIPSLLLRKNSSQDSDEETNERGFISERVSNDCESHQSLKLDPEVFQRSRILLSEADLNKTEKSTQTDCEPSALFDLLEDFNDREVKLGIQVLSKLASFIRANN